MGGWSARARCLLAVLQLVGGEVRPSLLFSSNMVLVASPTKHAKVFGYADPSEVVTLTDSSKNHPKTHYTATADATGAWEIAMDPFIPNDSDDDNNSFTLVLTGSKGGAPIVADNVAYGDVLLCSGQSNMAITLPEMYNGTAIIAAANHPEIRLFYVDKNGSTTPLNTLVNTTLGPKVEDLGTAWLPTTPPRASGFSAICYLTALELQKIQHEGSSKAVYGLIDDAIGSTELDEYWYAGRCIAHVLDTQRRDGPASIYQPCSWQSNQSERAMECDGIPNLTFELLCGALSTHRDQGENDRAYCSISQYNCLFSSMIKGWRKAMNDPDLPVAFVQLGGYSGQNNVSGIRFAQSDTLSSGTDQIFSNRTSSDPSRVAVSHTAMAPTYDLGSPQPGHPNGTWWIHCRNKTEVSRRLARQLDHIWKGNSKSNAHQVAELEWSGPTVSQTIFHADALGHPSVEIVMAHADSLVLSPAQGCVQCCNQHGVAPTNTTTTCLNELAKVAKLNAACAHSAPGSANWTCFDCVKDYQAKDHSGPIDEICFGQRIAQAWCGFKQHPAPKPGVPTQAPTPAPTPAFLFEVSNEKGVWLPATGSVAKNGSVMVVPHSNVTAFGGHWLVGVRFGVMDIPQCALYNDAQIPAVPFEFPVPYTPKN